MKVSAIIKLAVLRMGFEVGHQLSQLHRLNMMQTEFLKAGRVDQSGAARRIDPIQRGAGGGVLA